MAKKSNKEIKQEIKSEKPSGVISVIDVRTYAYNNNMSYMEAKKALLG